MEVDGEDAIPVDSPNAHRPHRTAQRQWGRPLTTSPGDGARYHGRGYIQLTGHADYRAHGEKLELPLEERPGMALRPRVGARVLAQYFRERQLDGYARRGQWREVRLAVNGGLNGGTTYRGLVRALLRASRV